MAEPDDRSVSIGRIFSRAFGVMGSNPLIVFGVALVLGAVPQILYVTIVGASLTPKLGSPFTAVITGGIVLLLVGMTTRSIVTGCITRATVAHSQGRRADLGDCLGVAVSRILPVIGVSLVFAILVLFGFVFLVVPGIILAVMWSVVTPIAVEERPGVFGAFNRSQDLTKGARWKIFGLFLLVVLIAMAISLACTLVSTAVLGMSYQNPANALMTSTLIMKLVVSTLVAALWSTLQTSLFVELREWKDGPQESELSDIFA